MSLKEYQAKRKFTKTPEPEGSIGRDSISTFVVQEHHASNLHYDFRLAMGGVLKSWAVPKGPSMNPSDKRLAMMVEDHPLEYTSFEGTIPKGEYGAGEVKIWDQGKVAFINSDLKGGHLTFVLEGKKLSGEFALVRIRQPKEKHGQPWLLIKAAKDLDRSPQENINELPHVSQPMLATLTDKPFDRDGWFFEIKWDGYRAIAEIGKKINLYSRNNISFNDRYPEIVGSLERFGHQAVLDGEVVVVDQEGKSSFQNLQRWQETQSGNLIYYVFDILFLDGQDLTKLPLRERKRILKQTLPDIKNVKLSDHVEDKGEKFFLAAQKQGIEGIIAKNADSPYIFGRTREWLKIKNVNEQEVVIGGFTAPRKSREYFGALVLGVYEKGKLIYVGHSGSGFDQLLLKNLSEKMKPLITKECPFEKIPKTNEPATWIKPKLVAEVKFAEWTSENLMRQPIFLGLREDKDPKEVKRENEQNH